MNILFFIGLAIIFGFYIGKLVKYIKLPSVVGYLIAGLFLGSSFFNIINFATLDKMNVLSDLALGIVAFIIGSEMRIALLRKMGKGLLTIILAESFGAFLLVFLGVYLLTRNLPTSLIFGAMAPASAPAGTVAVLKELKSGPLTSTLYAVVGLDDGLAIMIYAFAAAISKMLLMHSSISILKIVKGPIIEILGAILLGGLTGIILGYFIRKLHRKQEVLAISLGGILICTGLSNYLHFSLIMANLSMGMVFTNLFLFANRRSYDAINFITTPIFIVFFVIAGAHLQIRFLPAMGLIGLIYLLCRSAGLIGGAFLGATISKMSIVIRKYLGFGILSQAGVAIGLAILVTKEFPPLGSEGQHLAVLVINTIAATTIIFEIIGPIATKFAISKAGEIGKKKTSRY